MKKRFQKFFAKYVNLDYDNSMFTLIPTIQFFTNDLAFGCPKSIFFTLFYYTLTLRVNKIIKSVNKTYENRRAWIRQIFTKRG